MRIGLASSATAVRDNIDSARAPNITSFFIYNSCVRRLLLAASSGNFRSQRVADKDRSGRQSMVASATSIVSKRQINIKKGQDVAVTLDD
jgi:hypothetical protein